MTNKSALYEIDLDQATWRKASASAGQGECVELTDLPDGAVAVRDSKNLGLAPLRFTAGEWAAFRQGLLSGEL
ncbi:DUF397 domain-containing protein [Kineosporia rhizophila]|uniref:DUF397 domain-containing protein n=1 Tax=Kineosporia rhizophila TaxID=84633 RepID=UPI001E475AB0|nr:DUF397 domain-containing protein [Kineosporia rhizophila]MCE0536057.1 DUF397 domain-containing protein [Kineosporia rhizophila]